MDTLPLEPAGPQPLKLRMAVGGDASELFDMLLRGSRDRPEAYDLAAARPSKPGDPAARDGAVEDASRPAPSEPDDAAAAAAEAPGHRESSNPEARSDRGGPAETAPRDAAAPDTGRAGPIAAARDGVATDLERAPQEPRAGRGTTLPAQTGAAPRHIALAATRAAQADGLVVRVAPDRSSAITPPQRALGGQTALAAQAIAADPTAAPAASLGTDRRSEAAARTRPTAIAKDGGAAKTTTTAKTAETPRAARTPASPAAGAASAGLAGPAAGAGAAFAATTGGGPFVLQGSATSALGQAAMTTTGYTAPAARPAAAPPAPAEQVALQIRKASAAGQDRINIRLYPAELGRIDVKLEWADDGLLRVAISAERNETLDLLQRDSRALDRALQQAGLKTDSGSLSFDLRGHGDSDGTPRGDGQQHLGGSASRSPEQDAAAGNADPAGRRRAHDGILDLSV